MAQSPDMTREGPSFRTLYNRYLAAFNEHNLERTLSFLSPSIVIYVRGKEIDSSPKMISKAFLDHWSEINHPVTVHGEIEETADGVKVVLDDLDRGKRAIVQYHYAQEEGVWLHIRHDVKEVVPLPMADGRR